MGTSDTAIDVGLRDLPPLLFAGLGYDTAALFLFGVVLLVPVGFTEVQWETLVSFHAWMEHTYDARTSTERLFAECFSTADPDEDADAWEWRMQ